MKPLPSLAKICLLAATLLITACAGKGMRGHEPFVTLNDLRLEGSEIELDLGLRNVNSLPIFLARIQFSLTLGDTSLAVYNAASNAEISANGTENLNFMIPATELGRSVLESLQQKEINNIEYFLEGEITDTEGVQMKIQRDGFLYRVPGRPGQFR